LAPYNWSFEQNENLVGNLSPVLLQKKTHGRAKKPKKIVLRPNKQVREKKSKKKTKKRVL
jgi:hypothetical protein